ncbi:MAG: ATP synthase F0 subunit B [Desulfococcaceae bacterium]
MISVDSSLFFQIANFLVLIWAMNKFVYRPIRNILRQRSEKIDGLKTGIDASANRVKEKNQAYEEGIKNARAEGMKKRDAVVDEAETKEREIVAEINRNAQAELAKVREDIAKDVESVRSALMERADEFAREIGQKILGRAV